LNRGDYATTKAAGSEMFDWLIALLIVVLLLIRFSIISIRSTLLQRR
jgi:hypothetical protein